MFSLCFTGDGGKLALGGYDTAHHTTAIQFVPILTHDGWYAITLNDVKIGGKSIGMSASTVRLMIWRRRGGRGVTGCDAA